MAKTNEVPRFAHLDDRVFHELDISITEYFLLDMIFHLSGNGSRYCNKKIENIAADMKLSVSGVRKLRDRLIEKKLLKKSVGNRLSTSEKVYKVYFLDAAELSKSVQSASKSALSAPKSVQKVKKTPVENNYRIIREKEGLNNLEAQNPTITDPVIRAKARAKSDEVRRMLSSKFGLKV